MGHRWEAGQRVERDLSQAVDEVSRAVSGVDLVGGTPGRSAEIEIAFLVVALVKAIFSRKR